jgi:hypothetical protein
MMSEVSERGVNLVGTRRSPPVKVPGAGMENLTVVRISSKENVFLFTKL